MTSERTYVWTWLGGRTEPVVAGALDPVGGQLTFTYARSYRERPDPVPLWPGELPLAAGVHRPRPGHDLHGCLDDGAPDAWGRRVILHRLTGSGRRTADPAILPTLTYLLESGTDRVGAHDFQRSATEHVPREVEATLDEIVDAAERLEAGEPFSPEIDRVLDAGSSLGGARPKAAVRAQDGRALIAKFSTPTDHYPVVRAEAAGMLLARHVGLDVARVSVVRSLGRDVLLVERFDRTPGTTRREGVVSALTLLGLHEMHARYATYPDLADAVRRWSDRPEADLHELFRRIVLNILIGNRDDHARNHAMLWDGRHARLTPAYDLCPQPRMTGEATQAMAIGRDGSRHSRLMLCIEHAEEFLLGRTDAQDEVRRQVTLITEHWDEAAEEAGLTAADRAQLWGRAILHPYAFEGSAFEGPA
jgi:serine/threonine-protein kinase HipA